MHTDTFADSALRMIGVVLSPGRPSNPKAGLPRSAAVSLSAPAAPAAGSASAAASLPRLPSRNVD